MAVDGKPLPRELRRLQSGAVEDATDGAAVPAARSLRERKEPLSPTGAAVAAAASATAAAAAAPVVVEGGSAAVTPAVQPAGKPPRPSTVPIVGSRTSSRELKPTAISKPLAATQPKARAAVSKADPASDAGSPTAGHKASSIPVVSVAIGTRKAAAIPTVLATQAALPPVAVIVQPQPARRSTLLSKRSIESAATSSDTPAATSSEDGGADVPSADEQPAVGPSEEDLQDAEAAEALQFMQSMGMSADQPAISLHHSVGGSGPLPLPSPVMNQINQLEAVLGAAMSAASGTIPQPQMYKVPRRPREECANFKWPHQPPLLPATHENFFLPREWLLARAPKYEPLKRNIWVSLPRPKRLRKEEVHVCQCKAPSQPPPGVEPREVSCCGPDCLNRSSLLHCDPKYCPCGEACTNRPFHLLRAPRLEPFLTENRGYGVRATHRVRAGSFLLEYLGEVIDDKELSRRMEDARSTAQHSYYIMELAASQPQHLYIDARTKGSMARLVNSSCNPNCETQKWHDASTGEPRIGIFAKKDLEAGEELTYDYFFEQYSRNGVFNSAFFKCMCGAPNCRGMMDNQLQMNRRNKDYGKRVEVFWDEDGIYYRGTIIGYNNNTRRHTILYDDGDQEKLNLEEVAHRWIDEPPTPDVLQMGAGQHLPSPPQARAPGSAHAAGPAPLSRWGSAASNGAAAPFRQPGWAAAEGEEGGEEAAQAAAGRLNSQDAFGNGPQHGPRSIMGPGVCAAPPKKRQRVLGSHASGSVLPPLRTTVDNSYDSTRTTYNALHHAASAPAGFNGARSMSHNTGTDNGYFGNGYGGDMESLLQAVEVELGETRGEAAVGNSNGQGQTDMHAESWPTSPRQHQHHHHHQDMDVDGVVGAHSHQTHPPAQRSQLQGFGTVRSPRSIQAPQHHHHHAPPQPQQVRSPHRRPGSQAQANMSAPQQHPSHHHQHHHSHNSSHGHHFPQQHQEQTAWSWGASQQQQQVHAQQQRQQPHVQAHGPPQQHQQQRQRPSPTAPPQHSGLERSHAADPRHPHQQQPPMQHQQHPLVQQQHQHQQQHPLLAGTMSLSGNEQAGDPAKLAVIEEVLGIRISTFDMPLFQPANDALRHHQQQHGLAKNTLHSAPSIVDGGVSAGPSGVPPHMQRMPITTQAPGLGRSPSASAGAAASTTPPLSGPSQTIAATAVAAEAADAGGSSARAAAAHPAHASKLSGALALLVGSPILASLSGLHSGLCRHEVLAGHLDLFKRPHSSIMSNGGGSTAHHHAAASNGYNTIARQVPAHAPA